MPYISNRPLYKLGGWDRDNGFYAASADGRIHFIKENTDEKTIRAWSRATAAKESAYWERGKVDIHRFSNSTGCTLLS